jgi:hypothetical protein
VHMSEWLVVMDDGDVFDALSANHRLMRDGQAREVALIAQACDEWSIDESVAGKACERLIEGGGDGTALVGEFLALELAGLLGCSPSTAALRIAEVLDLRDRHPELWALVVSGGVEPWRAFKVTRACVVAGLSGEAARWVDHQLGISLAVMTWGRAVRLLDGLMVKADTELAARRAQTQREKRTVWIGDHRDGGSVLYARLDTADALALKATIDQIAEALQSCGDTQAPDQRQATALGILADPAAALALLDRSGDGMPTNRKATLMVHIAADSLPAGAFIAGAVPAGNLTPGALGQDAATPGIGQGSGVVGVSGTTGVSQGSGAPSTSGVARVEHCGPLDTETLARFLAGSTVVVRPVIDLNTIPPVDAYEIPARMRQAVLLRNPVEAFPFSTRRADSCDQDHTIPYDPLAPPGTRQTRPDNLGPLSRRTHRAKTARQWHVTQTEPGTYVWTSPHGFRYEVTPDGTTPLGRKPLGRTGPETEPEAETRAA